jgi:predicted PurR-regulated permease PerM
MQKTIVSKPAGKAIGNVADVTNTAVSGIPKILQKMPEDERAVHVEISLYTMVCGVLIAGAVWVLGRLVPVILVIVAALMIVGTFNPIVSYLESRKLSRNESIAVIFISFSLFLITLFTLTVPALVTQLSGLVDDEPIIRAKLIALFNSHRFTTPLADALAKFQYSSIIKTSGSQLLAASLTLVEIAAYSAGAFFLALYIMIDSKLLHGAVFTLVPRNHHIRLSRILINLQTIVGGYLRGQFITCLCIGVFLFVLLTLCHVQNPLAFAVFGAVVDILPFIGIFLTMVPVVLVALLDSQTTAIVVFFLLLAYEEFESRMLLPMIYGRALRLPSTVVFLALLIGGTLSGIVGALLALPIAAAVIMIVNEMRIDLPSEDNLDTASSDLVRESHMKTEYDRSTEGMLAIEASPVEIEDDAAQPLQSQMTFAFEDI